MGTADRGGPLRAGLRALGPPHVLATVVGVAVAAAYPLSERRLWWDMPDALGALNGSWLVVHPVAAGMGALVGRRARQLAWLGRARPVRVLFGILAAGVLAAWAGYAACALAASLNALAHGASWSFEEGRLADLGVALVGVAAALWAGAAVGASWPRRAAPALAVILVAGFELGLWSYEPRLSLLPGARTLWSGEALFKLEAGYESVFYRGRWWGTVMPPALQLLRLGFFGAIAAFGVIGVVVAAGRLANGLLALPAAVVVACLLASPLAPSQDKNLPGSPLRLACLATTPRLCLLERQRRWMPVLRRLAGRREVQEALRFVSAIETRDQLITVGAEAGPRWRRASTGPRAEREAARVLLAELRLALRRCPPLETTPLVSMGTVERWYEVTAGLRPRKDLEEYVKFAREQGVLQPWVLPLPPFSFSDPQALAWVQRYAAEVRACR